MGSLPLFRHCIGINAFFVTRPRAWGCCLCISAMTRYGCNIYILALDLQVCCKCRSLQDSEEVPTAGNQPGPPHPYLPGILSECNVIPHRPCFNTVSSSHHLYTYGHFAILLLFFTGAPGFMPSHHVCLIHACSCIPIYACATVALTS